MLPFILRRLRTLLFAVVSTCFAANALAQSPPPAAPDLAKARTIVTSVCAACHGADGNSPTAANPNLAGMPAEYITVQLMHFQAGIRTNAVMQGMAATLSPEDMKQLGVFFAGQKAKVVGAKDASLLKAGQRLYRGGDAGSGVPACSACHAPTGAGMPKNYPRLSGQYADYTYAQLKAFKSGERGADKDGKDANGRIMATIAAKMTDAQMKAVAEYASGLH
jgi:cytochrome c553